MSIIWGYFEAVLRLSTLSRWMKWRWVQCEYNVSTKWVQSEGNVRTKWGQCEIIKAVQLHIVPNQAEWNVRLFQGYIKVIPRLSTLQYLKHLNWSPQVEYNLRILWGCFEAVLRLFWGYLHCPDERNEGEYNVSTKWGQCEDKVRTMWGQCDVIKAVQSHIVPNQAE